MKFFLKTSIFFLAFFSLHKATKKITDGFAVCRLAPLDQNNHSDSSPSTSVKTILSQSFTYLGKGGQSYVFLSSDGQYVLKFFKKQHHLPDSFIAYIDQKLPRRLRPCRPLFIEKQEERFGKIFKSCHLAYDHLKEQTGLVYVHLSPSVEKLPPLSIYDRLGIRHDIDPATTAFLIQKKATLLFPHLDQILKEKGEEGIKTVVKAIIFSFKKQCALGIGNTDRGLMRNYGFLEKNLISFDIGSFVSDEKLTTKSGATAEILAKTKRLKKWLKKNTPSLISFYINEINSEECVNF